MNLLEARLGEPRAGLVIERAGGHRLVIPAQLRDNEREVSALEKLLGRELAIILVIHFGGETIYVPNKGTAGGGRKVSLELVIEETVAGRSAREIARLAGCSDRTVHARRAEARAAGRLPG